jgi:hypothetical protein
MYFNAKYQRTGRLFSGAYKTRHISDDDYLKTALAYVMLNPAELIEPRWKDGVGDIAAIHDELLRFPYASTQDFFGSTRIERMLIAQDIVNEYYDERPDLTTMLSDAKEYYRDHREL